MKTDEKGFSIVEMLIVVVIVGLIGTVGWLVYDRQNNKKQDSISQSATQTTQSNTLDKQTNIKTPITPAGVLVKTTDGHAEFTLPASWKVVQRQNGEDGQQYCGFAATDEATQGTCLLDVTYQPTALDTGGQTFWYAKIFKTAKSPAKWYADVVGNCKNSQEKTLNGYKELVCDSANYVVSNGQYLAEFVAFTDKAETKNYQSDYNSIINSIKFN